MAYTINISDGPSQWDLILSIFERKPVRFSLEENGVESHIEAYVKALSRDYPVARSTIAICEHGSLPSDSLLLEAEQIDTVLDQKKKTHLSWNMVYSVRTRKGAARVTYIAKDSRGLEDDKLRRVWGDLIWGSSDWRRPS